MRGKERSLEMSTKETFTCQHCGAEADITLEGFEKVEDVIKRKKKVICKTCGQEIGTEMHSKEAFACRHCGAKGRRNFPAKPVAKSFHGRTEKISKPSS
jgi:predicted RNA-binding Zn-ribbon protein involved in translation (DUF1610 family)